MLVFIFLLFILGEFFFIKFILVVFGSVVFVFFGISLVDIYGCIFMCLINFNSIEIMLLVEGIFKFILFKVVDISCIIDGCIEFLLVIGFIEG